MPAPADYVDVATRLTEAFAKYPDLRITEHTPRTVEAGGALFVQVCVTIHREPDDPVPCTAHAWEPFPGKTAFVYDSEMMNASTSAVGRALGLMGFGAKKSLAGRDEVETARARQPEPRSAGAKQQQYRDDNYAAQQRAYEAQRAEKATGKGAPTEKMVRYAHALIKGANRDKADFDLDTFDGCKAAIEQLKQEAVAAEEPF